MKLNSCNDIINDLMVENQGTEKISISLSGLIAKKNTN